MELLKIVFVGRQGLNEVKRESEGVGEHAEEQQQTTFIVNWVLPLCFKTGLIFGPLLKG